MVEKAPKYRATFKSGLPRVNLLGDMAPYVNTDVTNPRELYSMLSGSSQKGALLASVRVKSQTGAKLPPLDTSEVPPQFLKKHAQHNSYPDLASFRSEKGGRHDPVDSVRRSSSLQDLRNISLKYSLNHGSQTKKLKPILRDNNAKNLSEHGEKAGGVKFGQKEVHLIGDSPLPPIERPGKATHGKGGLSFGSASQLAEEEKGTRSPRHQRRGGGAEFPSELFPRGEPVEVKKPATPTYDDYPEAYWELRSPTVQDPSDLKEDMIDRDRYRLQQMSSLHLKAVNRELTANKLDSYRKWQQQMLTSSPPVGVVIKQDSARSSVTPSMAGPPLSARAGKQLRMSMPIQNDALAVAATSISPNTNPATLKRMESSKTRGPDRGVNANSYITEDELRRRQKIDAAARGENGAQETGGKPVKATVVNLCMDPDRSCNSPTSDVYNGIRKIMFGPRLSSAKAKTQTSLHTIQSQEQQSQASVSKPSGTGSLSASSIKATMGSSQSHRLARVFSAPTESVVTQGRNLPDTDSSVASKKILKKFNQLQVFSEKYTFRRENASAEPWEAVRSKPTEKGQYLPQSRPPTYKLDLKNYPKRHHNSAGRDGTGEDMGVIAERADGLLLLPNERGAMPHLGNQSPTKSETTSLNLQFRDGEVIVSRQEKRPKVT